jgi:uncharacterized membrane protein
VDVLVGTLVLRPYVFVFLAAFLVAAFADLGARRTAVFTAWVWPVAVLAELSSTRTGVPFGLYHYTGSTRGRELFIADVPFMDSLSFTFLAYAAFCLARGALRGRAGTAPPLSGRVVAPLSGALMMLLDVVIDPVAVRGDRWFLGRIFYYPQGGEYFGVPLSNFLGWALVGLVGVAGYLVFTGDTGGKHVWPGIALYYAVLSFNLGVTAWIGEWRLLAAGAGIHAAVAGTTWCLSRRMRARTHPGKRGVESA